MYKSKIEWTESTWNPITGCKKISPGCKFCYAERMSKRLQSMGSEKYKDAFAVRLHESALDLPLRWTAPRVVFVNSMSDMFEESIPREFIQKCFDVMIDADRHCFQILTKRAERLKEFDDILDDCPENIWLGVSVENQDYAYRSELLALTKAKHKFLSVEPLLGPIPYLPLTDIEWVIVGGESGPGCRDMKEEWIWEIKEQCDLAGIPFFFKQWGGVRKEQNGNLLGNEQYLNKPDFFAHQKHTELF